MVSYSLLKSTPPPLHPIYHPNPLLFDYYIIRSHLSVKISKNTPPPSTMLSVVMLLTNFLIIIFLGQYGQ